MRNNLRTAAVVLESNFTNGPAPMASHNIGRATQRATISGYN
jgi:hypothetical protein